MKGPAVFDMAVALGREETAERLRRMMQVVEGPGVASHSTGH
jgi:hypothetical protein